MLETESLDIVSVTTPAALHPMMTLLAARYPVQAIISEKPLANSMGEADAMLTTCNAAGIKLLCGYQGRHMAAFERARGLIADGRHREAAVGEGQRGRGRLAQPGVAPDRPRPIPAGRSGTTVGAGARCSARLIATSGVTTAKTCASALPPLKVARGSSTTTTSARTAIWATAPSS